MSTATVEDAAAAAAATKGEWVLRSSCGLESLVNSLGREEGGTGKQGRTQGKKRRRGEEGRGAKRCQGKKIRNRSLQCQRHYYFNHSFTSSPHARCGTRARGWQHSLAARSHFLFFPSFFLSLFFFRSIFLLLTVLSSGDPLSLAPRRPTFFPSRAGSWCNAMKSRLAGLDKINIIPYISRASIIRHLVPHSPPTALI